MLHFCYYEDFALWGALEEAMVELAEARVVRYIYDDAARRDWWLRTIREKLTLV